MLDGDSSRRSEEIVKISRIVPLKSIIIIIVVVVVVVVVIIKLTRY